MGISTQFATPSAPSTCQHSHLHSGLRPTPLFSLHPLAVLQRPTCSNTYISIVHPLKNISNSPLQPIHLPARASGAIHDRRSSCCCCARLNLISNEHVHSELRGRPSTQTIIDARTSNELHIQHITRTCDATTMARIPPWRRTVPQPRHSSDSSAKYGQAILTAENRFE